MHVDAVLQLTIFDVKDDFIEAGLFVGPVSVVNAEEKDTYLEKAYSRPVLTRISYNGKIEKKLIYPSGLTEKERFMLKGLYMPLEMVLEDEKKSYNVIQEDSTGEYLAEYNTTGVNLYKTKQKKYLSLFSDMGSLASIVAISKSEFSFKPSSDVWVDSIYGDESISYLDEQGDSVFSADIKISLKKKLNGRQHNTQDPFKGMSFEESLNELKKTGDTGLEKKERFCTASGQ